jgi:hypothetical protein
MNEESIWTVIITAISVLGSTSAWRYYERRALKRERDDEIVRKDCTDRISKLEVLLSESSKEKNEMRNTILRLTEQVSALAVKVEFLQRENSELVKALGAKTN